jgi:disulfide bond formation protein DsbB
VVSWRGKLVVSGCAFTSNGVGGHHGHGAAVFAQGPFEATDCQFTQNFAGEWNPPSQADPRVVYDGS